jgi:hypothetical protein
VQMRCCVFDVMVLVSCPAFRRQHTAPVDVFKIAKRKFIPPFRTLMFVVVIAKMPFCVFRKAVLGDGIIFLLRGRLAFAPSIPFVEYESSSFDQVVSMFIFGSVQFDCHDLCLLSLINVCEQTHGRTATFAPSLIDSIKAMNYSEFVNVVVNG